MFCSGKQHQGFNSFLNRQTSYTKLPIFQQLISSSCFGAGLAIGKSTIDFAVSLNYKLIFILAAVRRCLPGSVIWKLRRLRHFIVKRGKADLRIPGQVVPSLQTLSGVSNINLSECFVERFPNLKILKLKYTDDKQEYNMENLQYLYQLEELSILCDFYWSYTGPRPTNFVFPQSLIGLSLVETRIPLDNLPPIGLLPNLKVLKLKDFSVEGEEWEPVEGEVLQLEYLKMEKLSLSHWRAESIHFPCLQKLVIFNCYKLEEVPESIGEIDTLETLIVRAKSERIKIAEAKSEELRRSAQKIKEIQQDMGNDLLQVIVLDSY